MVNYFTSCSDDMDDVNSLNHNVNVVLDEGIFFELPDCLMSHTKRFSVDTINLDTVRIYPNDTAVVNIITSLLSEVSDFTSTLSTSLFSLQVGSGGLSDGIDFTASEKNSYYSSDDSKAKQSLVLSDVYFEDELYDFSLTISDNSDSKMEQIALKAYYDTLRGSSDKGCIIFRPSAYNQVRYPNELYKSTVCRIGYNFMKDVFVNDIRITSLAPKNKDNNVFYVKNLHLYISCSENIYSIYGNAYMPNLWFDKLSNAGYNLCFVVTSDYYSDKAVVYSSLVKSSSTEKNCRTLMDGFSAGLVLESMFPYWKKMLDSENEFYSFENPFYINSDGYKGSGDGAATDFVSLISDANLLLSNEFNMSPAEVSVMTISFE